MPHLHITFQIPSATDELFIDIRLQVHFCVHLFNFSIKLPVTWNKTCGLFRDASETFYCRKIIWGPAANLSARPAGGSHATLVNSCSARPYLWRRVNRHKSIHIAVCLQYHPNISMNNYREASFCVVCLSTLIQSSYSVSNMQSVTLPLVCKWHIRITHWKAHSCNTHMQD
jgi:hypothetical protein